jgi:MFS transporter, MCT family, solute carrier family 16 (monocarboxylic acid transporters), member 13
MTEPRYAWVVVWSAFVALAVIFGVSYSFAAFFEAFSAEFHAQRADVSMVFGLSGLIYFVLGAFGGMLADRHGPRVVACAGMLMIAAGLLFSSVATSLAMVYAAYGAGIGIGIALVYTPTIACVQPWFTQRRGLAAGLASAGIGAGTVVVPLLATLAIEQLDWRVALRIIALGVLVVGLGSALLLRRAPVAAPAQAAGAAAGPSSGASIGGSGDHAGDRPGSTLAQALRSRRFWWLYLGVAAASPSMFIPFAHVSASARDMGIADAQAVGLVGVIGVGSLVGRFVIGALADRLGRVLTLTLVQASAGLSYLLWNAAGGYVALVVFALWFGLSYGGIVSLLPAICMDLFGARAVSGIVGTLYTGAAVGNLLGPVLAGAVFDRTGGYAAALWACVALSALATAASARLLSERGPRY